MDPSSRNHFGANRLARVIQNQIAKNQEANSALPLDFGEIKEDYSLLTNTFPHPIPQADYLVCRHLTLGETDDPLTTTQEGEGLHSHSGGEHEGHEDGDGSHSHDNQGDHIHTAIIPETMRWLKPGDRVLVAWVQNDAVVIDLIFPASVIGQGGSGDGS